MTEPLRTDFLVLSRGKWDPTRSAPEIQQAIDAFYVWYERLIGEGRVKRGERLGTSGKVVSRDRVTDGPFSETKELVGGYWFIVAASLEEAATLIAEHPCLPYGLSFEVRPVDHERASAHRVTNETPAGGLRRV
jgi:hypothetical protein